MTRALRDGDPRFDREIPGYAGERGPARRDRVAQQRPAAHVRGIPSRASSTGFDNVYPVGEGAGHAGGIMSAAIDGARSAWALLGHRE